MNERKKTVIENQFVDFYAKYYAMPIPCCGRTVACKSVGLTDHDDSMHRMQ